MKRPSFGYAGNDIAARPLLVNVIVAVPAARSIGRWCRRWYGSAESGARRLDAGHRRAAGRGRRLGRYGPRSPG